MSPRITSDLIGELIDAGSREHYADPALYDYEYRRRRADIAWYRALAVRRLGDPASEPAASKTRTKSKAPRPRILELGAGSGRVTIALAKAGFEVVALDASKPMLAKLRERVATLPRRIAERITIVEGDLRSFRVPGKFALVLAVFNVIEHLYTRVELDACLRCVREHLAPGGAFAFDVQMPDLAWLLRDPWTRWARTRFTDPTTGEQLVYSTNHDYDPISQIVLIRLYYERAGAEGDGPIKVVKLSQRKYFPAELEALVAHAGFRVTERHGDFHGQPLDANAESQVLVCEVPRGSSTKKTRFPSRI
jgi:SAM-dependent methyltransferase